MCTTFMRMFALFAACAKASDADAASLVYQRMQSEGCKMDSYVFSALISAFNAAVRQRQGTSERRADLVLLERAFNLVDDMRVFAPSLRPPWALSCLDLRQPFPHMSCSCLSATLHKCFHRCWRVHTAHIGLQSSVQEACSQPSV